MLEPIRIAAQWLDGTRLDWQSSPQGVNDLLAAVPRWGSDPVPPNITTVYEETTDIEAALQQLKKDLLTASQAALVVWQARDSEIEGWVNQGIQIVDGFQLVVAYARRNPAAERAIQDGHYTMRAVRQSINRLFDGANSEARSANGVRLALNRQMTDVKPWSQFGDVWVTLGLLVTMQVEDDLP